MPNLPITLPDGVEAGRFLAAIATLLLLGPLLGPIPAGRAAERVTVTEYTDPTQVLSPGKRSYWMQPWRSYEDTVPAKTLLDAVGINFNVKGNQASSTAKLLARSGFTRARIEVSWAAIRYDDPSQMISSTRSELAAKLTALRDNGIRPLIVLNSNHGKPCPASPATLSLLSPAPSGAREVQLDPATINQEEILPGRTGITTSGIAANHLITSLEPDGTAHLSKPLASPLESGPVRAVTLRYEPFGRPILANGTENPKFQETLAGWLGYVRVIMNEVKALYGTDAFDVEIWNELSFGSRFLNINNYYEPDFEGTGSVKSILLEKTVRFIRESSSDLPKVRIGNGFANQSHYGRGLYGTAIDKHPYAGLARFPTDKDRQRGARPLNALGEPDGYRDDTGWHDSFTPAFDSYFPEYFLSAIQTESLIRDLAPYTSIVGGKEHGRNVIHEGSDEPSPVWVTEVNLPPDRGATPAYEMTSDDKSHLEAKTILRYLVAFVNKGVKAIHFYAARDRTFGLVEPSFFQAITADPGTYPGDALGGETMDAVRRLTASLAGAEQIDAARAISLHSLTDYSSNIQFAGDRTVEHGPLHNRDVLAFFPFQVTQHRFAIPVYVMTRDVTKVYDAAATVPARFDMPPELYDLVIAGIAGDGAEVEAIDPLTGDATPVEAIEAGSNHLKVRMLVTDSPRVLILNEKEPRPEPTPEPSPILEPKTEERVEPPRGHSKPQVSDRKGQTKESLRLLLTLAGHRKLLRGRSLMVRSRCDRPCRMAVSGRLRVAGRRLPMRLRVGGRGLAGKRRAARLFRRRYVRTTRKGRLVIGPRVAALTRKAIARNKPVSVVVTATARTSDGHRARARRALPVLSPRRRR